jgi:hypothetical protein
MKHTSRNRRRPRSTRARGYSCSRNSHIPKGSGTPAHSPRKWARRASTRSRLGVIDSTFVLLGGRGGDGRDRSTSEASGDLRRGAGSGGHAHPSLVGMGGGGCDGTWVGGCGGWLAGGGEEV